MIGKQNKPSPIKLTDFQVKLGNRLLFNIKSFVPEAGTSTVIIGATGSGKSVLLKAMAGLLPAQPFRVAGAMELHGVPAYQNGKKTRFDLWCKIRTVGITFVPAETAQAMNPALSLNQNLEIIAPEARKLVEERLKNYFQLEFKDYASLYPDEVSGGELQRITLMILLSRNAEVVFLDEPTVNLDRQLRKHFITFLNEEILGKDGKTILMVSHDLDFVRELKLDKIRALENSELHEVDKLPDSVGLEKPKTLETDVKGLELTDVSQHYKVRGMWGERKSWAFQHLNISFKPGHIYGITGPSGCGKTSMIKSILRLIDGSSGTITLDGQNLLELKPLEQGKDPQAFKPYRKKIAIVQQDSRYSFFPDLRIKDSLQEINHILGDGAALNLEPIRVLMEQIKLPMQILDAYPRSLSSGEMKRMDIVRVLASRPSVILLDEPFAHIDFETRALVMQAISSYLNESKAILIVVTHEDFDLKFFVQTDYDFLSMLGKKEEVEAKQN